MTHRLVEALANLREPLALQTVHEMLQSGDKPEEILALCKEAMGIVGQRFAAGEYFLPELVLAGEMLQQIGELVKPHILPHDTVGTEHRGTVVIGTVQGDVHDIGKNIVAFMLSVNGFEVHDLGIDVPAQRFVQAIEETRPDIVGLSCLLTVAFEAMKGTIRAIEDAGLRQTVKIMIGGGMVDERIRAYTSADAYGADAMTAVSLAQGWVGGQSA